MSKVSEPPEPGFWKPKQLVTLEVLDEVKGETQEFIVHKEFACHHSPVFKAAFEGSFLEGKTQVYKLENTTNRAVRLLVYWLYSQKLHILPMDGNDHPSVAEQEDENMALVELWVLADFLLIPVLQNQIIRTIWDIQRTSECIDIKTLEYTPEDGALRRFTIWRFAYYLNPSVMKDHLHHIPKEFLADVAILFIEKDEKGSASRSVWVDDNTGQVFADKERTVAFDLLHQQQLQDFMVPEE